MCVCITRTQAEVNQVTTTNHTRGPHHRGSWRETMSKGETVQIPDDEAFQSFRNDCESTDGWDVTYNKGTVAVWTQPLRNGTFVQKLKTRLECKDVSAETMYDVLHDIDYRKKWDSNVVETFDIGKLTANADVGYYSCKCKPLKNRDFITLRSWLALPDSYMIINHSVKHPKYPAKKECVRAVSLMTGYLVRITGANSCSLTYLCQVDPKGSLPKWVVNKASQFMAPKAMKKIYKACLKYPEWKSKHNCDHKPWLYPEQNTLVTVRLSELTVQHADSLERIDESGLSEGRDERNFNSDDEEAKEA